MPRYEFMCEKCNKPFELGRPEGDGQVRAREKVIEAQKRIAVPRSRLRHSGQVDGR